MSDYPAVNGFNLPEFGMQASAEKPELTKSELTRSDLELVPGVKSRPQYPPVSLNSATQHQIFITQQDVERDKADALLAPLIAACNSGDSSFDVLTIGLSAANGIEELSTTLAGLPLSSSFYVAGTEAFIWDVAKLIQDAGFIMEQIHLLPPVNNQRRLFCTHCYEITEPVTQSPAVCSGCGRNLLVRDHFSKIHRAYVGVQIDAEDPADLPEKAEELS
ncbi:MAG: hypothetical protein CMI08_01510 [Oceanospirillaceae bacterium]|nr:hypothetical protein [Oceanospirillaceae bacterium]